MVDTKTCCACTEEKPAAAFSRSSYNPDGLEYRCRSCLSDYQAARRAARSSAQRPPPRLAPQDTSWMADASCRGLDPLLFFPDRGEPTRPAKQVCADCPVQQECLEYAMANRERWGCWGGKSERQRRTIRRGRVAS